MVSSPLPPLIVSSPPRPQIRCPPGVSAMVSLPDVPQTSQVAPTTVLRTRTASDALDAAATAPRLHLSEVVDCTVHPAGRGPSVINRLSSVTMITVAGAGRLPLFVTTKDASKASPRP